MTDVKRPLADVAAEAYLRASRWGNYRVRAELDDGTAAWVQCRPGPPDLIYVEDVETGHGADFRLSVKATQLPALGPEDDGALRAELADAVRYAQEPQPALGDRSPADLVLSVLAAARAVAHHHGGLATIFSGPDHRLQATLEALDVALDKEAEELGLPEPGHWHPATWASVTAGQRIRVGGQHEAEVEVVLPLTWLGSGAAQVPVKLKDRGHYTMPPSGPVEVWTPSLPEWAAQAFLNLMEEPYVEGLSRA